MSLVTGQDYKTTIQHQNRYIYETESKKKYDERPGSSINHNVISLVPNSAILPWKLGPGQDMNMSDRGI